MDVHTQALAGRPSGVVAIIGKRVIWYDDYFNEMDDGFCISEYERYGKITPHGQIGAELEEVLRSLLTHITDPSFG